MLALREGSVGRLGRGQFVSDERLRQGRRQGAGQYLRLQEAVRARSLQGAGWISAGLQREEWRGPRGNQDQERFRERLSIQDSFAASADRRLHKVVICRCRSSRKIDKALASESA
jgi:hypothetical protein